MSTSPRYRSSLVTASTQAQAGSIPDAGKGESSSPPQTPGENANNGSTCAEYPFALGQWLAESPKDEPFNALSSARAPASEQTAAPEPAAAGTPSA
ncbi:hypothetical protein H0G86_009082 [Trichoderma simmonsii]|uniref:Uncharacterized protein n=1 Tax=Trichoderma simmonsii TaxID=1491479 RepID=A0A8G0PGT9_9HYPO|nr:hypothetical protein H0G86_009082 [Trichoderma simmonsii]